MTDVDFESTIDITTFFNFADVLVSSIIDKELINLVKYVYANLGIGDSTHGAGIRPVLTVYKLKTEYV